MERITGKEVKTMMEALHQVYVQPEEQVEVEQLDEAPQLSDAEKRRQAYTQSMNQSFKDRGGLLGQINRTVRRFDFDHGAPGSEERKNVDRWNAGDKAEVDRAKQASSASVGKYYSSTTGKEYSSYKDALKDPKVAAAANKPKPKPGETPPPKPAPAAQIVTAKNASGQQQQVTVGRKYDATLGGQKGTVTYDAAGKRTFTANKPVAPAPATPTGDTAPATPTGNTAADKTTTPPAKPVPTGTTADGTKFERRLPTMAELKAAQAARLAAKKAGADRAGQEAAAVKGGVGVQQSIDAALKAARARDTAPAPAGSALAKQQQAQGRTVTGSGAMGSAAKQEVRAQLGLKPINPQPAPVKQKQKPQV